MHILMKYPTRARPLQFLKTLDGWMSRASNRAKISVLVSYDEDDESMTPSVVAEAQRIHPALVAVRGKSLTKIQACNADLPEYPFPWDVVLLVSDDMICTQSGWDETIRTLMSQHYPDTNGALWFYDGYQKGINTLECVGRERYKRFGYLYHPSYNGFYCDDESTAVGLRDHKLTFIEQPICTHEHPCRGKVPEDATYTRAGKYFSSDELVFKVRKTAGFP